MVKWFQNHAYLMHCLIFVFILFQTHKQNKYSMRGVLLFVSFAHLCLENTLTFKENFLLIMSFFSFLLKMSQSITSRFTCLATCLCYLQSILLLLLSFFFMSHSLAAHSSSKLDNSTPGKQGCLL